jgi:hypothetical protein
MSLGERGRKARPQPSLAGAAGHGERRSGLWALGLAASRVAPPIIQARGGGVLARLKAEWAAFVGTAWANLTWPTGLGRDGCLKLRVIPVVALELQHQAPLLLDRINLYFGRTVAARLVLVQGSLPLDPPVRRIPPHPLGDDQATELDTKLAAIDNVDLREALAQLGRMVLAADVASRRPRH